MPKKGTIKFVSGYLIPSLNSQRFGRHLQWLDKRKKIFQIDWNHRSGQNWTEEEAGVFVEWDKYKGHYNPANKAYFTQSKQRFRALLYKLTTQGDISQLKSESKDVRIYAIAEHSKRRRRKSTSESSENENEENFNLNDLCDDPLYVCNNRFSKTNASDVLEDHAYFQVIRVPAANLGVDTELLNLNHDPCLFTSVYDAYDSVGQVMEKNFPLQNKPTSILESIKENKDCALEVYMENINLDNIQDLKVFDLEKFLRIIDS